MPQIKILDRHKITLQERQKAEKLAAETVVKKKITRPATENKYKGFSVCEKDLYKEVDAIHHREVEANH